MKKFFRIPALLLLISCIFLIAACKRSAPSSSQAKSFDIRGKILSVDPAQSEVMLSHEAIPGFMEAMTMPYKLKDPTIIGELHPGDRITAQLLVDYDGEVFHNARLDQIVVTAQGKPDYKPAATYHVPQPGEDVPDFHLVNQSGKSIHLAQYKGQVVLITFIYTRCPLGDYCPKMTSNFLQIDKDLTSDKQLAAKTHLLSISFDPSVDTPAVLKAYGSAYAEAAAKSGFRHWEFAAPSQADLSTVDQYFDIGVTPADDKTLTHSLSTVVIGPDGKIAAWYPGNDWHPADVSAQIRKLVSA